MLAGALVLPLAIGGAAVMVVRKEDRPKGAGLAVAIARGYPFALVLALTIDRAFRRGALPQDPQPVEAVVGRARARDRQARRVRQGPRELEDVLDAPGSRSTNGRRRGPVVAAEAPRTGSPVGALGNLVPDRLMLLASPTVEVLVYPSDVADSARRRIWREHGPPSPTD